MYEFSKLRLLPEKKININIIKILDKIKCKTIILLESTRFYDNYASQTGMETLIKIEKPQSKFYLELILFQSRT